MTTVLVKTSSVLAAGTLVGTLGEGMTVLGTTANERSVVRCSRGSLAGLTVAVASSALLTSPRAIETYDAALGWHERYAPAVRHIATRAAELGAPVGSTTVAAGGAAVGTSVLSGQQRVLWGAKGAPAPQRYAAMVPSFSWVWRADFADTHPAALAAAWLLLPALAAERGPWAYRYEDGRIVTRLTAELGEGSGVPAAVLVALDVMGRLVAAERWVAEVDVFVTAVCSELEPLLADRLDAAGVRVGVSPVGIGLEAPLRPGATARPLGPADPLTPGIGFGWLSWARPEGALLTLPIPSPATLGPFAAQSRADLCTDLRDEAVRTALMFGDEARADRIGALEPPGPLPERARGEVTEAEALTSVLDL